MVGRFIPFSFKGLKLKILEEAKTYAEYSGSTQILTNHALTAINIIQKRLCVNGNHVGIGIADDE